MRRGALIVAALAIAACSSAYGSNDRAVDDAGAVTAEGDAGGDAGASFCETQSPKPLFCSDFDQAPIAADWPTIEVGAGSGATVGLDETDPRSAPRSLRIRVQGGTGTCQPARVVRSFPGPYGEIHLGFALRTGDVAGGSYDSAQVMVLDLATNAQTCALIFKVRRDFASVQEQANGSPTAEYPLGVVPQPATWSRVTIDVTGPATDRRYAIAIDGQVVLGATAFQSACQAATTRAIVRAGLHCHGSPATTELRLDDITFDGK